MSAAMLAWTAAWALAAILACGRLLRARSRHGESVIVGYRWLAVAALCVAVGASVHQAFGGLIGGALPLRLADLIGLGALPALIIGLATMTADLAGGEQAGSRGGRLLREHPRLPLAGPVAGTAVDSGLFVGALFVLLLVTLFSPDWAQAHIGRAAFALALLRPLADLCALGLVLRFAVRGIRLTLAPLLALATLTIADSLAVADRTVGRVAGLGTQVAVLVALLLLAVTPSTAAALQALDGRPVIRLVRPGNSWSSPATIAALAVTAVAAIVATGLAVAGRPLLSRPLVLSGAVVVLLLVVRLAGLTRQASAVAEAAQESGWMFSALAGSTSDAVLICDLAGTIEFASRAVADFGYAAHDLTGCRLADIVHPEDRPAGVRAAVAALRADQPPAAAGAEVAVGAMAARPESAASMESTATEQGTAGQSARPGLAAARFAGRVRGADGSWRHVEAGLSRFGLAGEPARLLITARDVSDRVALRRQLTQLTFHDGLTGLPNRAYVEDRVKDLARAADQAAAGAAAPSEPPGGPEPPAMAAVILVDFDGYTAVNDLAGHAGGDLVLAQAARRLRAAVPPTATVARWGGDEFAVLTACDASVQDAVELAERLAGLIAAEPFTAAAKEVALTASVGVAVAPAGETDQLLGNAQIALTKAQDAGVGRVEVFVPAMAEEARRRAELADDLRRAIGEHQMDIEYLPVVELASGAVRGVEATVRWFRDGAAVAPREFLAVAEETGLIAGLGDWMLRKACMQVAAWRAAGSDVELFVRCTARQAGAPGFVPSVVAALDEAELPAGQLTIGVSERTLTGGTPAVAADLAGLRGKGVRLALDSFGTGMVSLDSLRRSAVDVIRVDACLVTGIQTEPALALLTKAVIGLARDLGITVIADGIEQDGQRSALREMGCALGQGPGLAGPVDPVDIEPISAGQAGDTACTTAS